MRHRVDVMRIRPGRNRYLWCPRRFGRSAAVTAGAAWATRRGRELYGAHNSDDDKHGKDKPAGPTHTKDTADELIAVLGRH